MLMKNDVNYLKLRNVYNRAIPDEKAEQYVKKILRLKESQKMIESEILALYQNEGITPKSVIQKECELYDLTLNNKNYQVSSKILDNQANRMGLNPVNVTKSISISAKTTDYRALLEGTQSGTEPPKQLSNDNTPPDDEESVPDE